MIFKRKICIWQQACDLADWYLQQESMHSSNILESGLELNELGLKL